MLVRKVVTLVVTVDAHRLKIQGKEEVLGLFPGYIEVGLGEVGGGVSYFWVLCIFINKFFENFPGRVLFYPPSTSLLWCIYGCCNHRQDVR